MGCCKSLQAPAGKKELMKQGSGADFRDVFTVGARLGAGTFGTVFECSKKIEADRSVYAVKMMEHQSSWWGRLSSNRDSQWQMFAQEFKMMKEVSHPNLIRMVGVFIDDYFVYFVMDKYESNLINAVLPYLKKGGSKGLSVPVLAEIMSQMLGSIVYLHERSIVHRDVKADNYLVDGNTFRQRDFKVVLTDLSTARYLEEGVFLKDTVGTKEYWAPELVARSYAHQVDVFAIGVIYWCMMTSKFPFASVQELFTKQLVKHRNMTDEQFELVCDMLQKNPVQRLSAKAAQAHRWVASESDKHKASIGPGRPKDGETVARPLPRKDSLDEVELDALMPQEGLKEKGFGTTRQAAAAGASDDQDERIAEKMRLADKRFQAGEKVAVTLDEKIGLENANAGGNVSTDKQRQVESRTYEWWSEQRCSQKGVPDIDTKCEKGADKGATENFTTMCAGDVVVGELADSAYLDS
jgi:serine/threonine protein kinase